MKIPTVVAVPIIIIALLGAIGIGYLNWRGASGEEVKAVPSVSQSLPYETEEGWSVWQISQFLSDFGSLAQSDGLQTIRLQSESGGAKAGDYEIHRDGKTFSVSLESGVWNPATYQPLAKPLLGTADSTVPEVSLTEQARTLLSASQPVFLKENARISGFLQSHPASAAGHLQAAALLGVIALNDYSGSFRDLRVPINRMIAHLAAADSLGIAATDPDRQFVEILRLTLSGLQADALKALAEWKPADPDGLFEDWRQIFKLRNTSDWRDGRARALKGSPALQREYFRALVRSINGAAGLEFLREAKAESDPSLWRIANESNLSVSGGHVFTKPILEIEFEQISEAARAFGIAPSKDSLDWLKTYLDTPEGSPVQTEDGRLVIQVAGRNLFAGYNQRNLLQGMNQLYAFLNDRWGVKDDAEELKKFLLNQLPALRYKPFLIRIIARANPDRVAANEACARTIHDQPEIVTPALWSSLRNDEDDEDLHLAYPDFHAWFRPEVPRGTAFESGSRLYEIGVGDENNDAWMKELWERAPYSYPLALQNAFLENGRSWKNLSAEILKKWVGPLADYNLRAMKQLANCDEGQPALYEEAMEKAAAIDPNCYLKLGAYFVKNQLPEKAAEAYLLGFERATDRVWMANDSKWLVQYLYEKGGIDMANKVAADAAEVYSFDGLKSYIWLKEQEGKWDEALETARKIDERYGKGGSVNETACLFRMHEAVPEKAIALGYSEKVNKIFPDGARKVELSHFVAPPTKGVIFKEAGPKMVPFGLRKGSIVVALDGYQTDTFDQYLAIRSLSDDPRLRLIVWDGTTYRLSEGDLPDRRFGVDMGDFVASPVKE